MNAMRMLFPGARAKALTLSYDDGVEQDARLIAMLERHGVKGTFNLNSGCFAPEGTVYPAGQVHRRLTENAVSKLYASPMVEVAAHGYTHPFPDAIPSSSMLADTLRDRAALEKLFGRIINGYAYPYGAYNAQTVELLRACGIRYARTVHSTHDFSIPDEFLMWNPTCHHRDAELTSLWDKFAACDARRGARLFYLWGHAYEFEGSDNWNVIESFLQNAAGHEDIWYATNGEICDYTHAFRALVTAVDGAFVHNPTATDVWFAMDGKTCCVKAGETLAMSLQDR